VARQEETTRRMERARQATRRKRVSLTKLDDKSPLSEKLAAVHLPDLSESGFD
jgi:hypothetical protein